MSNSLIPDSKDDMSAIERIKKASLNDLEPVLDQILEYLQDRCWPIYIPLVNALSPISIALVPHIRKIFKEARQDSMWKHNILTAIMQYDRDICFELRSEIFDLTMNPTPNDILDGNVEVAEWIINDFNLQKDE